MRSFRELFAAVAVPRFHEHFGKRDADGNFATLFYRPPSSATSAEPFEFTGISSPVRSAPEPDFDGGGINRMDTKTWRVPKEQFDTAGITTAQIEAAVDDHDSRSPFDWSIRVEDCVFGETGFVTLALHRAARVTGNKLRRAVV